jgi:hypothetical protein
MCHSESKEAETAAAMSDMDDVLKPVSPAARTTGQLIHSGRVGRRWTLAALRHPDQLDEFRGNR